MNNFIIFLLSLIGMAFLVSLGILGNEETESKPNDIKIENITIRLNVSKDYIAHNEEVSITLYVYNNDVDTFYSTTTDEIPVSFEITGRKQKWVSNRTQNFIVSQNDENYSIPPGDSIFFYIKWFGMDNDSLYVEPGKYYIKGCFEPIYICAGDSIFVVD